MPVRKVHVIISNHFDAGYTDLTASSENASDFAEIFMRRNGMRGRPADVAVSAGVINTATSATATLLCSILGRRLSKRDDLSR